ncbi:GMC family oxidoreductase [Aspergillus ibericus CBS 121593]|uniref:Alcohol oxidase n=1 Tax=Aspergillus ibericus CBS 121593 TaxID=1448316 RepID=A0A395GHT5_9EURO|nr:alcohol oxidase [Aspergillus ibericus CBS 121593]RAK94979.1 alcohol oxidase [Aspergillus ibericus CBS 121593]
MMKLHRICSVWAALAASASAVSDKPPPLGTSFGVAGRNATFDYIVVGGGTAGLTLATRLAEQQTGSVAVIEAGGFYEIDNGNLSQVPASAGQFTGRSPTDWQPLIDWGTVTTPQAGTYGTQAHYARGKCLGGSSARHSMVYHRGTRGAYQQWADTVGDDSFTFDNLLPFFEKNTRFTPPDLSLRFDNATPTYDVSVLGNGSNALSVTYPHYVQAFTSWATQALEAIGISKIPGLQSGALLGQGYTLFSLNATTMLRESSETAYLRRALGHPNYMVYQSTMAKRILFNEDQQATGVLVETEGLSYQLNATQEIIISAGVFGSPQLLLVSGIGPAATLEGLGIPVVADRPGVGQNMHDHVYVGASHRVNVVTNSRMGDPVFAAQQAEEFNEEASGMLTSPGPDVLGWEKIPADLRAPFSAEGQTALAQVPDDWPEVEYLFPSSYVGPQNIPSQEDPHDGYNYAAISVALVTPQSRGTVTIASPDASMPPVVDPNWLTASADIEVLLAGFKRVRQLWNTDALTPLTIGEEAYPGPQVQTDAEIEDYIRRNAMTARHAACTCAMGRPEDPMAVVDTQARVLGVQGLRVVDASMFPLLPPGHPQATIYAIAEKLACNITSAC